MKGEVILLIAFLAVLPVLSVVSASVDTTITVFSGTGQTIQLNVLDRYGESVYVFNETQTDSAGKASFTYTSGSRDAINFSAIARGSSGNIIKMKKFGGYFSGDLIALDMTTSSSAPTTPVANTTTTTVVNTTNTTSTTATVNTTNTPTAAVTTSSTDNGPGIFEKSRDFIVAKWIWIVGIIVVLIIIYVLIRLAPLIKHKIESMPKASIPAVDSRPKSRIEAQLYEAEKKIKQAQAEINELRNKDSKVKEAERKFEEAKRDLERAKRF